jgi:hypothetical protein
VSESPHAGPRSLARGRLVPTLPSATLLNTTMSDSDSPDAPDASVLGKRVRNEAGQNENDLQASVVNSTVEDDSDDDVGPMPMPAQAPAAKKKRRGIANCQHSAS